MKRLIQASLGSVIHGTMRPEDLIPAFTAELRRYMPRGRIPMDLYKDIKSVTTFKGNCPDEASELVATLCDRLNDFAPNYAYFGSHEGDGSDYGFWLLPSWQEDARTNGAMFVSDLADSRIDRFAGEAVVVNDHGNATLYYRSRPKAQWREVWAVV